MRHDVRPIREVLSDYYDHVDELARRDDEIVGVPTALPTWTRCWVACSHPIC